MALNPSKNPARWLGGSSKITGRGRTWWPVARRFGLARPCSRKRVLKYWAVLRRPSSLEFVVKFQMAAETHRKLQVQARHREGASL